MALNYKVVEVEGVQSIAMSDRGFPIVVDDENDNKEIALDAIHLYTKVPELTNQLSQTKDKVTELTGKTAALEGIEDVADFMEKANAALELTANIDSQKLIDAGKVEEIKTQAQENLQTKMDALKTNLEKEIQTRDEKLSSLDKTIFKLMVADRFNTSKFVKEGLSITSNMARKYFGDSFKIEVNPETGDRSVVGYYRDGTQIYSAERPGDLAQFDEALQLLVEKDPEKDNFLLGAGGSGTGAGDGQGGTRNGEEADLRAQYDAAVESKNTTLRIALKNQLAAKGIFV